MKKRVTALILTFSMLLACAVLSGCEGKFSFLDNFKETVDEKLNQPDPYVEGIRTAVQDDYGVTYGEAFEYFFTDPVWISFVTDDDVYVVEFTGNCNFRNTPVSARIQFTILEDGTHFKATYLALNGTTQTEELMSVLFADAFEAYKRSGQ